MNKYLLLIPLATALGGYYLGRGTVIKTVEVHDIQVVEKVVERVVTVTKIVHPDGTVEETTRSEDRTSDTTVHDRDTNSTTTPALSNYSLGVRYHVEVADISSVISNPYRGLEVTVGRRILGDVWLDAGLRPLNKEVSLGVRIDL